jgi:Carboxypeptidase regulatory-like domain
MKNYLPKVLFVFLILALCGLPVLGQVTTTGSILGTVTDPTGAVVPNATVTAKNKATGKESTATTSDSGNFNIPQLSSGVFVVTVSATSGFKKSQVTDVKVDAGTPATVNVVLELGNPQETVTVVGGGELIQTQSATIGTTLTGRQITDIPTASRNALDLVLALPGTSTVGRPRQSSVNGLPKGALNITLDGMNVQDNLLKSNDGFFTYIQPRTDAISEVTVSTSTPGAESSGEGAYQIKFVTQGGTNGYHGGGYWYYRSPGLNANYWFNNNQLKPDPISGRAARTPVILNQPGFKIGGPISIPKVFNGKDKAFFFLNYEEYRLPESTLRTRILLSTPAQSGLYRFFSSTNVATAATPALNTTCAAAPAGSPSAFLCSTDVYARAAGAGLAFANADPTISGLLASIRSAAPGTIATGDPNLENTTFINKGGQLRRFPTVRFDFNLTKKHHIENIWNYQSFGGVVDFLNNVDPAFPGFPNHGSQTSIRFSDSMAWRWTVSNNIVNEARYGIVGGTVLFFGEVGASQFTNQGGYSQGIGAAGVTSATVTTGPQRRNSPVREFSDSLSWIKGNHSMNFGATATRIAFWQQLSTVVPSTVYTTSSLDSATTSAFSSLPSAAQAGAAQLYAVLAGRLTAINANARLDETTNKYSYLGSLISRAKSFEWGVFGQDSWRFRPNVTLTFGLRYERQEPIQAQNDTYAGASYAALFGESGTGNLFKPGVLAGAQSQYTLFAKGTPAYNSPGLFLPSFGFTYSPNFTEGMMHRFLGAPGQTVFRGGFSIASVREGTNVFQGVTGANPGGTITTNRSLTLGNLPVGTYLRQGPFGQPTFASAPTYPNPGLVTDSINGFDPNLKIGYVESWSVGIQREIKRDNVVEIRYVGNRGHQLWRQIDLNELNIVENGVFNEFKLAQQNLLANIAAGRGAQFRYQGPGTGTVPLPITFSYLQAQTQANAGACATVAACNTLYGSSLWANATSFVNSLNPLNPSPLTYGTSLSGTGFDNRRTPLGQTCYGITTNTSATGATGTAGCTGLGLFPYNMFLVNAGKRGDPFVVNNSAQSWYDGLTVEYRRRMSAGLLIQGSYTFGKALSNTYASSSSVFDQPNTLRNLWLRKGVTPFDIRNSFKTNFIYELPVGKGKMFMADAHGITNAVVGGWVMNGNIRIQSGNPFSLGNVQLVGITKGQLENLVNSYRDPDGFIYVFPKDIRDQTIRANNVSIGAAGASYTLGAPSGRFIAPAGFNNCQQPYSGGCGFANLVLHGPRFTRFDLSLAKKINFSEHINLEMRVEMLNAFNNINFLVGSAANDVNTLGGLGSTSFGRMTAAYQDTSTTNDPGGRIGQLVLRLNF